MAQRDANRVSRRGTIVVNYLGKIYVRVSEKTTLGDLLVLAFQGPHRQTPFAAYVFND